MYIHTSVMEGVFEINEIILYVLFCKFFFFLFVSDNTPGQYI